MDLRQLRQFAAVAETLHFGRAAERLQLAQPALSQGIRKLEAELGVRLFERSSRRVELSAAGRALAGEVASVMAAVERAAQAARAAGAGRSGRLRLGYTRSSPAGVTSRIVEAFRARFGQVELDTETGYTARNLEGLKSGRLDAAFVCPPLADPQGLVLLPVGEEAFVAVLPRDHRLARRRRLRRTDLLDEPLVTGARERGPGFFDTMFAEIWGAQGPRIVRVEADEEHILRAVAEGVGVSVITESRAATLSIPGVVVRRFEPPAPRVTLALAWPEASRNPALARLVEVARAEAAAAARAQA